jgi:hypothetical protein
MRARYVLLFAALVATMATGCSFGDIYNGSGGCGYGGPDGVTEADLVSHYYGTDAGSLTLNGDRTFVADGLRVKDGAPDGKLSGHGTWALRPQPKDPHTADDGELVLTFVHDDGTTMNWTRIDVGGDDRRYAWLYYLYGDLESCDLRRLARDSLPGPSPSPS